METVTLPERVAGGTDQRWFPAANTASLVQNYRYEPSGGWRNDRGWEPLIPYSVLPTFTAAELDALLQPCRFLQIVQRHQGAEEYYLQERAGELFYEFGNRGTATVGEQKRVLAKGRYIPKSDDCGTQAIPFGRFTLIINGKDPMLKWWGRDLVEPFGFMQSASTPTPLDVQTDYNSAPRAGPLPTYPPTNPIGGPNGNATINNLNAIAVQFPSSSRLGLGDPEYASINTYTYFITNITNTGSESPRSATCTATWDVPKEADPESSYNNRKYGVLLQAIEPGPEGTVARRIYRTKNKRNGISGAGDIFYFVRQIDDNTTTQYLDVTPDNQLTAEAPSALNSVVIPTGFKYGAAWNGRMWLGGGDGQPFKLVYSEQGLPEQFGGFNYFDVGVRDGGHITALYPYYDVLLVFRERAIDAVFTNASGDGFTCTTVKKDVGTTATNTIKLIPGYGVMFLNKDGFWLVKGGMRGGAELTVESESATIEREMGRLSINALPRACAAYSDKEKEYFCLYPVDGQTENTQGAAYHIVNGQWSLRGSTELNELNEPNPLYDWRFTQIATDQSGYFILGTRPDYNASTPLLSTAFPGVGLQVWSARRAWGDTFSLVLNQGVYTLVPVPHPTGNSIWRSVWEDFGDDSVKKRILTVELDALTEGSNGIELQWSQDYDWSFNSAGNVVSQIADYVGSKKEQPTYSPTTGAVVATWSTTRWEDPRVTRLRWDVRTGLVSHFQFQIISSNLMQIVRYQMNFVGSTVRTPNTRAPGAKS
jgi:hypothetical protein